MHRSVSARCAKAAMQRYSWTNNRQPVILADLPSRYI
jgi:hypothetical protein